MTNRSGDLGVPLAAWGRGGKEVQVITDGFVCSLVCVFVQKKKTYHLGFKSSLGMLPISPVAGFRWLRPGFCPQGRLQRSREKWKVEGKRPEGS